MSRDKQIEEMARDICECYNSDGTCYYDGKPCDFKCDCFTDAQYHYEKGYRKSTDVAEEIFEKIEGLLDKHFVKANYIDGTCTFVFKRSLEVDIAELKKKYIGKDINVPNNTEEGK